MIDDSKLALFLMLGQSSERTIAGLPDVAPSSSLPVSPTFDLASSMPESVKRAQASSDAYQLLFVFEEYLRQLVLAVLSQNPAVDWWSKVPPGVRKEVEELEDKEETKAWMALGSRGKDSLMTFPQLLQVMDECWKQGFSDLIRDKGLIQEARLIAHLRNAICHMSVIPEEEFNRIKQTMRDWFRMVAP